MMFRTLMMLLCVVTSMHVVDAQVKNKKDYGAVVAGVYDGVAFVELMQREMKLKLELVRTYRDSVQVKVVDFLLPTGQKFSYKSKNVSVKQEVKDKKKIYKLNISFLYTYNGMPMRVDAKGTISDGELDAEVIATIMESMQTKVTYKAKKQTMVKK